MWADGDKTQLYCWMPATGQYSVQQQIYITQLSIVFYNLLQCNKWILCCAPLHLMKSVFTASSLPLLCSCWSLKFSLSLSYPLKLLVNVFSVFSHSFGIRRGFCPFMSCLSIPKIFILLMCFISSPLLAFVLLCPNLGRRLEGVTSWIQSSERVNLCHHGSPRPTLSQLTTPPDHGASPGPRYTLAKYVVGEER